MSLEHHVPDLDGLDIPAEGGPVYVLNLDTAHKDYARADEGLAFSSTAKDGATKMPRSEFNEYIWPLMDDCARTDFIAGNLAEVWR